MGRSKKNSNVDTMLQMAALVAQQNATAEANRIQQENVAHQKELANINKNMSADLTNDNRALVETAGTANEAGLLDNPDQKRKRDGGGLASTLGIN